MYSCDKNNRYKENLSARLIGTEKYIRSESNSREFDQCPDDLVKDLKKAYVGKRSLGKRKNFI